MSYLDYQQDNIKTWSHEKSIDPGPQNTFWLVLQNVIFIIIRTTVVAIVDSYILEIWH